MARRSLSLALSLAALVVALPRLAAAEARPLHYERALTAPDLEGRTLRELSLMRNTIYARAGHTFRKQWLQDHFKAQPWYKPLPKDDESKITAVDRENARAISRAEQGLEEKDLEARREQVLARQRDGKATPEDGVELRLLNERLGDWASATKDAAPPKDANPLEDPAQLDGLLQLGQLEDLSRRDLRILRNTVYARHGRPFKSLVLQDYFFNMDWYKVDEAYSDKKLSKIDRKNIQLIKSVESSLGGPIGDRDHRGEDEEAWMSQS